MKMLAVFVIAISAVLSGCVVEPMYRGDGRYDARGEHDRDRASGRADRDGDGVPNRQDRRPDDARRY